MSHQHHSGKTGSLKVCIPVFLVFSSHLATDKLIEHFNTPPTGRQSSKLGYFCAVILLPMPHRKVVECYPGVCELWKGSITLKHARTIIPYYHLRQGKLIIHSCLPSCPPKNLHKRRRLMVLLSPLMLILLLASAELPICNIPVPPSSSPSSQQYSSSPPLSPFFVMLIHKNRNKTRQSKTYSSYVVWCD